MYKYKFKEMCITFNQHLFISYQLRHYIIEGHVFSSKIGLAPTQNVFPKSETSV